jgi:hypothetical protein
MTDINRPLRRLEVARRIQELRDRAAAEEADVPQTGPAAVLPADAVPAPDDARAAEPVSPVDDPAAPVDEPAAPVDDESSAAATIASLLRGGQTWLLDRGQ